MLRYRIKIWISETSYGYLLYDPRGKPEVKGWTKFMQSMRLLFMV
jgi:hypothetical protein